MTTAPKQTPNAIAYCLLSQDYFRCAQWLDMSFESKTLRLRFHNPIEHNVGIGYELVFKAWLLASGKTIVELKTIGHDLMKLRRAAHCTNFPIAEADIESDWHKVSLDASKPIFVGCLERLNAKFGPTSYRTRYPISSLDQQYNLKFLIWAGLRFTCAAQTKCNQVFTT